MSGPKSQDFSLIQTFDTHKEFNEYLIAESMYFATEKSSLMNCSMCRSKTHKLRYKIGRCNDNTCNNTDEPCEHKVKETQYKLKHHLKTAVEVFQDVISYESRNGKEFKSEIRIRKYMRDLAKTIVLRKQIISTSIDSEYLYKHFNPNLGLARINILSKTCTCHKYFDKGVCKHLIAACMLNNISLPGMAELPKKFLVLRRRQKVRYQDESISEENIETNEVVTTNESVQAIVATD
jgi:hypothetical protein